MPHPLWYYDCLPGTNRNDVLDSILFEYDINTPRDEKKNLVGVRVHLPAVRRIACHEWGANHESIDSGRRSRFPRDETRRAVALQPEKGAR
jgi:hypothetical protein